MLLLRPNTGAERIYIWLCDCGCIHIETRHCRRSFTPAEFLNYLRSTAGRSGAGGVPPYTPAYLDQACESSAPSRAAKTFNAAIS